MTIVVDNDIIIKCSCYGLVHHLQAVGSRQVDYLYVLGTARFVATAGIRRVLSARKAETAVRDMNLFLDAVHEVEPNKAEVEMAADFEAAAQRRGVPLDGGESLLCAVMISRRVSRFYTGDKRAAAALELLLDSNPMLAKVAGRVYSLEHLFLNWVEEGDCFAIRRAVCDEPKVDLALSICFHCTGFMASEGPEQFVIVEALQSYISDLRKRAKHILALP